MSIRFVGILLVLDALCITWSDDDLYRQRSLVNAVFAFLEPLMLQFCFLANFIIILHFGAWGELI